MIAISQQVDTDATRGYAKNELIRILSAMTGESLITGEDDSSHARTRISLGIDHGLADDEIQIVSTGDLVKINGGSSRGLQDAVYAFLETLGCIFELSGELLPSKRGHLDFPVLNQRRRPSVPRRGIRMHLNFVQDQSFWTEEEFQTFIDNMARQKLNMLLFHMYTPQQWFPFQYRGVKHLDLFLGNLHRKPLSPEMIGRDKVRVKDHWFPQEFEHIRNPEELLAAMHARYCRMMRRARERGIRNVVSLEPESLPPAVASKIPEWAGQKPDNTILCSGNVNDWQQEWSGIKFPDLDIRHPLITDISVERCLQGIEAFPDLDELQLISREGVKWNPPPGSSYDDEIGRLCRKFDLPESLFDRMSMSKQVSADAGPEMNLKAHPYWTVLPGENYWASVMGAVRFVEFAMDIFADPRLKVRLAERNVEPSIAVYSPNPEVIRLIMPLISAILAKGMRFYCLADYGANDIASNMQAWRPLADSGHKIGVMSWLEFDGSLMLAQGWSQSIGENVRKAVELGADTMLFNHWRLRGLEHNAAAAAAACWNVKETGSQFEQSYFSRLFGNGAFNTAVEAYGLLEEATKYAKAKNYNIGFTNDWVFRNSTDIPGYHWRRLAKSADNFTKASDAFRRLVGNAADQGRRQASYMADLCHISALHVNAVSHLQNAKLPLFGYKAWPIGNTGASCPSPELLEILVMEARKALECELDYMRIYSKWVESSDEQGQLCLHQQGVMEPFAGFADKLAAQLECERSATSSAWPEPL